jgi:hypothetical protein
MKLPIFERKKSEPYIPAWEGVRTRARRGEEEAPLTFHLFSLSMEDMQEWEAEYAKGGTEGDVKKVKEKRDELLIKYIDRIENLEDPQTGDVVCKPGQLFDLIVRLEKDPDHGIDAHFNALLGELFFAIQARSTLELGLAKNWHSSSDSEQTKRPDEENSQDVPKDEKTSAGESSDPA